jgi:lactate dehydrogenase-like 2-hydroxyacid dehydrogenase
MPSPHVLLIGENVESHATEFAKSFTVHRLSGQADKAAYLRENGQKIEALCLSGGANPRGDKALLDQLPNLSIVATLGVGIGAGGGIIDVEAVKARQLIATYGPGSNAASVADLALAFMLALSRRLISFDRYMRAQRWAATGSKGGYTGTLTGSSVGILGLGNIGQAVARRCAGFDMEILYHQRTRRPDVPYRYCASPAELAAGATFLIVAVPDTPQTEGMVNADVLRALGPDGFLVNVSRGAVVDEEALVKALAANEIAGAGLDVFRGEPKVQEVLLNYENVILSPHRAAFTHEATLRMRDMMIENLKAHFAGRAVPNPIPGFEQFDRGRA